MAYSGLLVAEPIPQTTEDTLVISRDLMNEITAAGNASLNANLWTDEDSEIEMSEEFYAHLVLVLANFFRRTGDAGDDVRRDEYLVKDVEEIIEQLTNLPASHDLGPKTEVQAANDGLPFKQ